MPALKSPKYTDHPAEGLSKLISTDVKEQFLKTPKKLLIENPIYNDKLSELRNHFNYSYLIQWIYSLKHLIKLQDAFDVENFEEELLNIAPPIFINNLKIKLIQYLKNEKLQNIDIEFDFYVDQIYQDFKLIEFDDNDNENDNNEPIITYSKLSLIEKIDVLYNLPAAVEPFTSEPAAVEPVKLEPAAVEPVTSEPAAVEPIQAAQTDSDKPSVNNVEEPVQPISK
ncbi:hypothetical protein C6P40_003430 [Pichia californica]|uniref:Uncharacterized protein n=1 Tax=Pichia californica TaxID=460514 RepID=A0A9P6WJ65_9ASCO|nr:hypothetical protein C6P40_003430 [[Candida] californica]